MTVCPNCGEENRAAARFCSACGGALAIDAPTQESRRTVTIVFCDLVGSTALGERLDSESLREVMSRYFASMRSALERHGATIEKYIGDAVMAVFGLPRAHEDDALRAVRAALEMAEALGPLNEELDARWGLTVSNRTGVATGEVTSGDASAGQRLVTGDAVNVAARLEQASAPGQVLIGEPTYRLVRGSVAAEPVEPLTLKGKSQPFAAYRLIAILPTAEAIPRRADVPIVGRDAELRLLQEAFDRARSSGRCALVTVEGEAGIGKSRLVAELVDRAGPGIVALRGRCLPYGESSSLGPAGEVVRASAEIGGEDSARVARGKLGRVLHGTDDQQPITSRLLVIMGLAEDAYPLEELFWAVRRLLEERARAAPTAVLIEDVHWAKPTTLALLVHVATCALGPLLLVCTARPDLRESYPDWPGELPHNVAIRLGPLGDDQAEQLAEGLLRREVPRDVTSRIAAAAEGNPLFVEQLVSMLVDEGLLVRRGGRWRATSSLAQLAVPPSIAALLAARLDRLPAPERAVIERAAVVGPILSPEGVAELCTKALRPMVEKHLASLVRKDFLIQETADSMRFGHALIREAAYGGILKRTRAELHERFARWLERTAQTPLLEREELIASHLEQAFRNLSSLGPVSPQGLSLAIEASARFRSAGLRALARTDAPSAVDLLSRASALTLEDLELRLDLAEALGEAGHASRAEELVVEVIERARAAGDARNEARGDVLAAYQESIRNPAADASAILARAERATSVLEEIGTEPDRSSAWFMVAMCLSSDGRSDDADVAIRKAISHSARAGDEWREGQQRAFRVMSAVWGALSVGRTIALAEETLAWAEGMPSVQGRLFRVLGHLKAMDGRLDEGRADFERSRSIFARIGTPGSLIVTDATLGEAMLLAGRPEEAERELRHALGLAQRAGTFVEFITIRLALAVLEQGRAPEAASLLTGTEHTAEGWDSQARILMRSVGARIWAALGQLDPAERAARAAIEIAESTELLNDRGEAWFALGEVLDRRSQEEQAADAYRRALDCYERKGNRPLAERVRERIALLVLRIGHDSEGRSGGAV